MGSDPQSYLEYQRESGLAEAHKAFEDLFGWRMAGLPFDAKVSLAREIIDRWKKDLDELARFRNPIYGIPTPEQGSFDYQDIQKLGAAIVRLTGERDEALKVRDLARAASQRDLEDKRQAEADAARLRALIASALEDLKAVTA